MSLSNYLRRVRWAWALPITAVAVTASLIVLARSQDLAFWVAHPGISDTPGEFQAPARFFEQLISGPGFYFPIPYEYVHGFARLPGVALFWAWLGLGLDRRLHGVRSHIIRSSFWRGATYALLLGVAALFAWKFYSSLPVTMWLPSTTLFQVISRYRLRVSALGVYVEFAWAVLFLLYFGYKLISTIIERPLLRKVADSV